MTKKLFLYFANLRLAIVLLLLIAVSSSLGSFVEQNKETQFYQEEYNFLLFGIPFWKILLFFKLDNIYNCWWFLSLLIFLGISLLSCTYLQQLPTLKFSRRYYFYKQINQYNTLFIKLISNKVFKSKLTYSLFRKHYSLFFQKNCIYAYKGLISKLGPIIVHLSLICILLGSTLGAVQGFTSQEVIAKTEIFHMQNIIKTGLFSNVPQQSFRINDFWSTHLFNGNIKQFYSDISVLNSDAFELKRKTISVNNPLLFNDLTFYQTDWGILGFRLHLKKGANLTTTIQIPVLKVKSNKEKIWISALPFLSAKKDNFILSIKDIRGQLSLFNNQGQFLQIINIGEPYYLNKLLILNFIDVLPCTGIQIKLDPGLKIIYFGFLFLIISSLISYFSFSEFWLLITSRKTIAGAKTNRSKVRLTVEFLELKQSFINFYK
uniref:Cytochrome c biogenesis protein n=1 Tax=Dictyotopsis propagulifera TaxID=670095 RepID=UPI002E77F2C7|nr:Cytochrome c biogenesis protein [Dictyotopsis propagulifera]WAM63215.1 Cytochrome c biogenesis protein [Dictyotopsis propagulifera]